MGIEEIRSSLKKHMDILSREYGVKSLEIFGSYSRGESKGESDIDILIEFNRTIDLFTYVELEDFLSRILGIKVDLVMKETLKPRVREKILKEAIAV